MLALLFPPRFDNDYRGHWLGLVVLGVFALVRLVQSSIAVAMPQFVIQSADGIPFDAFDPVAQLALIGVFRNLAWFNIALCVLAMAALLRYRAMVPLMLLVFTLLLAGQRLNAVLSAIPRDASSNGPLIANVLLAGLAAGLVLSLWSRRDPAEVQS